MLLFSCHSSSSLSVSFWRTTARKWDVRPLFSLSSHCFWWERLKHPFSSIGFIFQMSIPLFSSLIIRKASFTSFLLFDTRHPNFLLGLQFRPFCSLVIQCILSSSLQSSLLTKCLWFPSPPPHSSIPFNLMKCHLWFLYCLHSCLLLTLFFTVFIMLSKIWSKVGCEVK